MYPPPYYTNNNPNFLKKVMQEHSFAFMTTAHEGDILGTHLPFVFDADEGNNGTLYGHIAANNPQVKHIESDASALITFNGPHAYVSATWYEKPQKNVPTWDYISVQANGSLTLLPKDRWLGEMQKLTQVYEEDAGWQISNAQDYVDALMRGIVYFKMEITSILGIEKMSQNKSYSEKLTIISELRARKEHDTADAIAEAMKTDKT